MREWKFGFGHTDAATMRTHPFHTPAAEAAPGGLRRPRPHVFEDLCIHLYWHLENVNHERLFAECH